MLSEVTLYREQKTTLLVKGEGSGASVCLKQPVQESPQSGWRTLTAGVSTQSSSPSLTLLPATPNRPRPASYFTWTALEKAGKCLLGDFSSGWSRGDLVLVFFKLLSSL